MSFDDKWMGPNWRNILRTTELLNSLAPKGMQLSRAVQEAGLAAGVGRVAAKLAIYDPAVLPLGKPKHFLFPDSEMLKKTDAAIRFGGLSTQFAIGAANDVSALVGGVHSQALLRAPLALPNRVGLMKHPLLEEGIFSAYAKMQGKTLGLVDSIHQSAWQNSSRTAQFCRGICCRVPGPFRSQRCRCTSRLVSCRG